MRTGRGPAAAVVAACVAGLVAASGQPAAAAPSPVPPPVPSPMPPPIRCDPVFSTQPRQDDFVVHSVGEVDCDATASRISGTIVLLRDGEPVGHTDFDVLDTAATEPTRVWVMPPCVAGPYQATIEAHWWNQYGAERSGSARSQVVDITC